MQPSLLKNYERIGLLIFLAILITVSLALTMYLTSPNEFSQLAWSFINGKTYFLQPGHYTDYILYNDHQYYNLPPLPALVFLPFNLIWQQPVEQNVLIFLSNIILGIILCRFIYKKFNFSLINSLWLTILYLFSSVYIICTLVPLANYFAHTVATILLILAFQEYLGKKKYWLIGIFLGLVCLTRFTAGLGAIFFIAIILNQATNYQLKIKNLVQLLLPIFCCGLILLSYNYIRFANPFNSGYSQVKTSADQWLIQQSGLFNLRYLPSNFYYYFLESFSPFYAPAPEGQARYLLQPPYFYQNYTSAISFFLISPLFLLLFKLDWKKNKSKFYLLTAGLILLVLLSYYYNGYPQIGPRYLNDLLPLLFIPLLFYFQNHGLNYRHKIIIIISCLLNLYLSFTLIQQFIIF